MVRTPAKVVSTLFDSVESSSMPSSLPRGVTGVEIIDARRLDVMPFADAMIGSRRHLRLADLNSSTNAATYVGLA